MEKEPTEISYFSALIMAIVEVDIKRLTWFMVGLFFLIQALSHEFKIILYGFTFVHWIDFALMIGLTVFYLFYANMIGKEFIDDFTDATPYVQDKTKPLTDKSLIISANIEDIENQVLDLYKEDEVPIEVVLASLASILGATLMASGSKAITVKRDHMDIQVSVTEKDEVKDEHD